MKVHRTEKGAYLRCREANGRCPYGGGVGETITRNKSGKEDYIHSYGNGAPLSSGVGYHIRKDSTNRDKVVYKSISSTRVYDPSLDVSKFTPEEKKAYKAREVFLQAQESGVNVDNIISQLRKDPDTASFVKYNYMEFDGTSIVNAKGDKIEAYQTHNLPHAGRVRVMRNGAVFMVYVEGKDSEDGVTNWLPVGTTDAAGLSTGTFLWRANRANMYMTKLKPKSKEEQFSMLKETYSTPIGRVKKEESEQEFAYGDYSSEELVVKVASLQKAGKLEDADNMVKQLKQDPEVFKKYVREVSSPVALEEGKGTAYYELLDELELSESEFLLELNKKHTAGKGFKEHHNRIINRLSSEELEAVAVSVKNEKKRAASFADSDKVYDSYSDYDDYRPARKSSYYSDNL